MTGGPSLDDLKIARVSSRPARRVPAWMLWALLPIPVLSAAMYFWPSSAIAVRIVTAEAVSGGARASLDATGYVVARRPATLSAKILGKLVEVNVEEGQHVAKGQVVARLDDSNYAASLRQARALAAQARAGFGNAEAIFARYRRLHAQDAISTDAFENQKLAYDAARTGLGVTDAAVALAQSYENDTVIRAPYSGVVTEKSAQIGEIVAPAAAGGGFTRTGIATIVDMDSLEVEVDVSENYIDRVQPGSDAHVRLDAYPDWEIPASVIAVVPTADQSKGTVKVRIAIAAKDARILPQMGARVAFQGLPDAIGTNRAVQVPADAVKISGAIGTVYRIVGDGDRVEARQVPVGAQAAGMVTLLSGVSTGERLAAGDLSRLADGARVRPNP
jgi:RND family efflux transporter MFP subunit